MGQRAVLGGPGAQPFSEVPPWQWPGVFKGNGLPRLGFLGIARFFSFPCGEAPWPHFPQLQSVLSLGQSCLEETQGQEGAGRGRGWSQGDCTPHPG